MSAEIISPSASDISLFHRPYGPRLHRDEEALAPQPFVSPNPPLPADAPAEFESAEGAAKYLLSLNKKPAAESAKEATAANELPVEGNAAPAEKQANGEDAGTDPADEPLIELPKSWAKERAELWKRLDPEAKQVLLDQDRTNSAEVRRAQNDAATERNAAKAEREAAEQARQKYESKLPLLEKKLQTVGPFADIQSPEDLRNLQRTDPFRFQEYQLYVWEQHAEQQELREAETRKAQERQSKRNTYEAQENARLVELVPEMANPKKASELRESAIAMLNDDYGLKNDLLSRWMTDDIGHEILSNAGFQKLIADGLKARAIRNASKAIAAKTVPPVQRPGTASSRGEQQSDNVKALNSKLTNSGDIRDAVALYAARKSARR